MKLHFGAPNMIMKEKHNFPLEKRADFPNQCMPVGVESIVLFRYKSSNNVDLSMTYNIGQIYHLLNW